MMTPVVNNAPTPSLLRKFTDREVLRLHWHGRILFPIKYLLGKSGDLTLHEIYQVSRGYIPATRTVDLAI
jgi:hypothetical protein